MLAPASAHAPGSAAPPPSISSTSASRPGGMTSSAASAKSARERHTRAMLPRTRLSANFLCIYAVLPLAAAAWIGLFLAAQDLWRRRAQVPRLDLALALALFAAALALRALLPVPTLVHENHHGYQLDP